MKIGGKYRLVRLLGEGGMGVVWAAVNELTEREVALKLIRGIEASDDARGRLLREARACGRIVHRNVVQIYDVGETEAGDPFLVMELLNGETVGDKLERELKIAPDVALRLIADTARGLRAAHGARVMHRDLKPSNLFLHFEPDTDAVVLKIVDFGVSKTLQTTSDLTATGRTMGSPAYMSPEQVKGLKTVDHRTDLWSLGAVLAEMISGKRVFQGLTPYGAAAEVLSGKIRSLADLAPGTDPRIVAIVDRCLQRDLDKRFSTADEILDALNPLLTDDIPPATTRSIPPPPPNSVGRASLPPPGPLPVINMTEDLTTEMVAQEVLQRVKSPAETNPSAVAVASSDAAAPGSFRGLPVIEDTENSSIHIGLPIDLGDGIMLWSDYVRQSADGDKPRLSQIPPDPAVQPTSRRFSQPPPEPVAPGSIRLSQPPPADLHPPLSKKANQNAPSPPPPTGPDLAPGSLRLNKPPADLLPSVVGSSDVERIDAADKPVSDAPLVEGKTQAPAKRLNVSLIVAFLLFAVVAVAVVMKLMKR
ncbi:MAG TPA: protein kinase [Polyangium sp.]|nr:protein kinase [Polyangium sp.]